MVGYMIDAHTHVFPDEIINNPAEYFSLDSESIPSSTNNSNFGFK